MFNLLKHFLQGLGGFPGWESLFKVPYSYWFLSMEDAREKIVSWREEYNSLRMQFDKYEPGRSVAHKCVEAVGNEMQYNSCKL